MDEEQITSHLNDKLSNLNIVYGSITSEILSHQSLVRVSKRPWTKIRTLLNAPLFTMNLITVWNSLYATRTIKDINGYLGVDVTSFMFNFAVIRPEDLFKCSESFTAEVMSSFTWILQVRDYLCSCALYYLEHVYINLLLLCHKINIHTPNLQNIGKGPHEAL